MFNIPMSHDSHLWRSLQQLVARPSGQLIERSARWSARLISRSAERSGRPLSERSARWSAPVLAALGIALLAFSITSCTKDDGESTQIEAPTASDTSEQATVDTESAQTDELIIYTYDAFPEGLEDAIVTHMADDYEVQVTLERFQDTGSLYNEVYLTGDGPSADLVIGLDNTYIGRALEADLFQPYAPAGLDGISEELILDDQHRLVPFDYGSVVLNYDSEVLANPPETWQELLDPRFEESIVLMNPSTSSPGRNFLLLTIAQFGEEGYLDYWKELKPNILTVTAGWSEGYGLYTQGEAPIVLSYETSPAYHIAYEDTTRYRNLILDGAGYGQVEVAGITKNASNLLNARRAMDFVLSTEFQTEIPLNQFMYPVREDVELPPSFQQLQRPDTTVFMDVSRVDANFEAWLADWEDVMR